MPYLFIGAGQAGSAIVDEILDYDRITTLISPLVFNSTVRDLQNLTNIESEDWYGISQRSGLVEGTQPGFEEKVTGGFGRNPVEADKVMEAHQHQIEEMLTERYGRDPDIPFAFIFLGLGGGTGCGIAPHIIRAIQEVTNGVAETVAVGILPNTMGPSGAGDDEQVSASRQSWNTMYGIDRLEEVVDGFILADNQQLAYENAAEGRFSDFNEYIASGIVDIISGPILERIDPSEYENFDPPTVDIQDIITSLSFDVRGTDRQPGYASLGRSVTMTKSLPGYLLPFVGQKQVDTAALSRMAARKQTIANADAGNAKKALGFVRAPIKYYTDDKYRVEVSIFRQFLEGRCTLGEVNVGIALTERNIVSFTALFTHEREDLDRLAEIQEHADQYETETEAIRA
jgi:hypothetical protein